MFGIRSLAVLFSPPHTLKLRTGRRSQGESQQFWCLLDVVSFSVVALELSDLQVLRPAISIRESVLSVYSDGASLRYNITASTLLSIHLVKNTTSLSTCGLSAGDRVAVVVI